MDRGSLVLPAPLDLATCLVSSCYMLISLISSTKDPLPFQGAAEVAPSNVFILRETGLAVMVSLLLPVLLAALGRSVRYLVLST